ncbi:MAG: STAS domain-containing protein [Acidimicrobiia bacterium]
MAFQVASENYNGRALLRASGEIDLATVDLLDMAVGNALQQGLNQVVIDMTEVSFMDSTGIRSLLTNSERINEAGGKMSIVLSGGPVARTLAVTGVDALLSIYDSISEATA